MFNPLDGMSVKDGIVVVTGAVSLATVAGASAAGLLLDRSNRSRLPETPRLSEVKNVAPYHPRRRPRLRR